MSEEEAERRNCGCPFDYHLADCPIVTARYQIDPWECETDED